MGDYGLRLHSVAFIFLFNFCSFSFSFFFFFNFFVIIVRTQFYNNYFKNSQTRLCIVSWILNPEAPTFSSIIKVS